jgi:hypothetical protein
MRMHAFLFVPLRGKNRSGSCCGENVFRHRTA